MGDFATSLDLPLLFSYLIFLIFSPVSVFLRISYKMPTSSIGLLIYAMHDLENSRVLHVKQNVIKVIVYCRSAGLVSMLLPTGHRIAIVKSMSYVMNCLSTVSMRLLS